MSAWGAYVHVPWCRVQCPYCAFAVVPGDRPPEADPWSRAIRDEFDERAVHMVGPPQTLFFGGGTPSRLSTEVLAAVVDHLGPTGEVSAEANPEDLSPQWLVGAREAGIQRLSVGVQSFRLDVRKRLGRAWVDADPGPVVERVAQAGFRSWSVDLIFAVPDQTMAQLDHDLDRLVDLDVPHVALYGLTIEPGTPFQRAAASGRLPATPDDLWRRMYDRIVERLSAAGLERYELSNFARPGHESRHNQGYWEDRPYLGLGPSAHGYLPDGVRYQNHRHLATYLSAPDKTESREHPDPEARCTDLLVSGLRGREGVDLDRLVARSGRRPSDGDLGILAARGMLWRRGSRIGLTHEGFPLCDAVIAWLDERCVPVGSPAGE